MVPPAYITSFYIRELGATAMDSRAEFALVCKACGSLGVRFDIAEGADFSTPVRCGRCDAFRGSLGHLRILANKGKHEGVGFHLNARKEASIVKG